MDPAPRDPAPAGNPTNLAVLAQVNVYDRVTSRAAVTRSPALKGRGRERPSGRGSWPSPWIEFRKGERKDAIVQRYRERFTQRSGVVLIGVAQERASAWAATKQRQGRFLDFRVPFAR